MTSSQRVGVRPLVVSGDTNEADWVQLSRKHVIEVNEEQGHLSIFGGKLTDWGAHLMDTAQVPNFAEGSGPTEVHGKGEIPENAMNSVPMNYDLHYTYANGVTMHVQIVSVLQM